MTKAEIDAIVSDVFRPKKITKAEVYAIVEDVFRATQDKKDANGAEHCSKTGQFTGKSGTSGNSNSERSSNDPRNNQQGSMNKEEVEKYKNEIINKLDKNFKEKATSIFSKAKNNEVKNVMEQVQYRKVDAQEATKLKEKTGLDLEGYNHTITNMDIQHIYNKHGDEKAENFRGQRAVTEKDILLIPEITKNYDDVMLSPQKNKSTQQEVLVYRKKIGDEFVYLETISGKKSKELRSNTMWIVKKK